MFRTVSFGVTHDVHPVPRPPFAKRRHRYEPVDCLLPDLIVTPRIVDESLDLTRRRYDSVRNKIQPPQQGPAIGEWGLHQSLF